MRWTLFSIVTLTTVFAVGFFHRDVPRWQWAECLPFSSSRAYPMSIVYELSLLAQIVLAVYLLANVRRWRLEEPEIVEPPLPPRQFVTRGFCRLGVLAAVNLLALWAGENADVGLRFCDLIIRTLGINPNYLENAAAFCTLTAVLAGTVISVYIFFGAPRATTASMAPPVPPMGPPGFRSPGSPPPPPLRRP